LPGFDDRLKQHLERVAPPADPTGAYDRILEKKIRRRIVRRLQAAGLAFAVVAATIGGTWVLVRAFESGDDKDRLGDISPTPVPVSNGLIAYASHLSGNWDIWTARSDGTRADNVTAESVANETDPTWSPDGKRIAFVSDRAGNSDIYVMNADGASVTQLTDVLSNESDPAWSPDGSMIAYASGSSSDECVAPGDLCKKADIFVSNADGSGARQVAFGAGLDVGPTWAPDGSMIAFARVIRSTPAPPGPNPEPATDRGIYLIRPDGTGQKRLTGRDPSVGDDLSPDWSPDGREIVFARGGYIHVMNTDGSGVENLAGNERTATLYANPAWSPDGTKIVFEQLGVGPFEILTMNADGSQVTQTGLLVGKSDFGAPDWQPVPVTSSASPTPTTEPSPTPTPFPPECDASEVTGNFDGDGQPDTATVAKTACLADTGEQQSEYSLQVRWPPSEGIAPLPSCLKACKAVAAADLNGDGIDEFILQVDARASTDFFQVYELPASETFGRPAIVAPPGSRRWPPGEPAEFSLFGSVLHFSAIGCDLIKHEVIEQDVGVNEAQTEYLIHESRLRFEPVDSPPFGRFTVISERDYTEPYEGSIGPGDQFEPGDPCWIYGG
jgi:TolB protein